MSVEGVFQKIRVQIFRKLGIVLKQEIFESLYVLHNIGVGLIQEVAFGGSVTNTMSVVALVSKFVLLSSLSLWFFCDWRSRTQIIKGSMSLILFLR